MFKSSFSKYLTAFICIILISFLMLSGIITSMIRTHIVQDKEEKMLSSCEIIKKNFVGVEDIKTYVNVSKVWLGSLVSIAESNNFDVIITDDLGDILVSTIKKQQNGMPGIPPMDLGKIDLDLFETVEDFETYKGEFDGIYDGEALVYGLPITTSDDESKVIGHVFAFSSTDREDEFIRSTRRTVIYGSVWIMLAAVIAAYFITERIVHPLKDMTRAAKRFGKGDFSERLTVIGNDEVSELAIAFNNMAESLESLEAMRNSFLANVSHDLRTPMTTISGFIDGIISGAIPEDQRDHYLGVISSEVHRLSRLVSQLLDISRLESGDRKFIFADFDIAELSRLILISLEQKIDEKNLDVEFNTDDAISVKADKDAIHQVIYNLCHNAIKFSRQGGKFTININRVENKRIKVSVFDQGQVIDEEDAKHIFDRFYKTDKSRGLDKNGVGLGLYICKTIVDAHGENISLDVHEDGCEFSFTLKEGEPINKHKAQ